MTESNPYTTPTVVPPGSGPYPGGGATMVNQIRIVAILMMVHGLLAFLMGLFYLAMGVLIPMLDPEFGGGDQMPPNFRSWMFYTYFVMGGPAVIFGVLQTFAGWRMYDLRSRTLGILAVTGGVFASATCYCAPTAIALAIYGLIVLLSPMVAKAFQWRAEGASAGEVLGRFNQPYAHWQSTPPTAGGSPPPGWPQRAAPQQNSGTLDASEPPASPEPPEPPESSDSPEPPERD